MLRLQQLGCAMLLLGASACTSSDQTSALNWDQMNFAKIVCADDGDVPAGCPGGGQSYAWSGGYGGGSR